MPSNRKDFPTDLTEHKLKKGEVVAQQACNITIMKWHDKRDVLMLSTCHGNNLIETKKDRNGSPIMKPEAVQDYNQAKQGIDLSNQMSSYYTCLRKSLTWYKKLAIELIFGTALVNSCIIYNELHPEKSLRQLQFIENLIRYLVVEEHHETFTDDNTTDTHQLKEALRKKNGSISRRRCYGCYEKLRKSHSADYARKKCKQVSTECRQCKKAFCLVCFNEYH